jgi:hypothetical protein
MTARRVIRLRRWLDRQREELHRTKLAEAVVAAIVANNTRDRAAPPVDDEGRDPAVALLVRRREIAAIARDLRAAADKLEVGDEWAAGFLLTAAADHLANMGARR